MPLLTCAGPSCSFTDEGTDEDPMVFVHGFSCDSHDWSWQLPHFGASHRVIADGPARPRAARARRRTDTKSRRSRQMWPRSSTSSTPVR